MSHYLSILSLCIRSSDYRKSILAYVYSKTNNAVFRFIIRNLTLKRANIVVSNGAKIGYGLRFPHAFSIIIGEGVQLGEHCKLYNEVTLGQNSGGYPRIGDNVIIYPGSRVVGSICVGNNVVVGANSVVCCDVPDNAIVAGSPAKVIRYRSETDEFY